MEKLWNKLKSGLKDYCDNNGFNKVILGLSGGLDSAICAVLAKDVLGGKNVKSIMMKTKYTSDLSLKIAREIAELNEVDYQEIDIEDVITIETLEDVICATIENVESSVVGIKCVNSNALLKSESFGSGVVVKQDKNKYYIVTNRHVVMKQGRVFDNIDIYLGNIDLYIDAKVIEYSEYVDLALLEVETDILLKTCTLGENSSIKKGKYCIAVGSPYDLKTYYNTVTIGNISSIKRVIQEDNYFNKDILNEYIQSTAPLNEGCSGGGLFNLKGELIGINTWKLVDSSTYIESMSFSISIDIVKDTFSSYLD